MKQIFHISLIWCDNRDKEKCENNEYIEVKNMDFQRNALRNECVKTEAKNKKTHLNAHTK